MRSTTLIAILIIVVAGCRTRPTLETGPCEDSPRSSVAMSCELPAWDNRPYVVLAGDADGPRPVIFALHGGGGNSDAAARTTCPGGELESPKCLHAMALERGYVVILPNGIGSRAFDDVRTWNAGGGEGNWRCVAGRACDENIDDVGYIGDVLDDVASRIEIDRNRVYSTGLSNGGAMSHRLACELDEIAAIVAVGGANQFAATRPCEPNDPVAVMQIHGTEDPCWRYDGGPSECPTGQGEGEMQSVAGTMDDWSAALGCSPETTESAMPNPDPDGVESFRVTYSNCGADLELIRMEGAGHTWPGGYGYFSERLIGKTSTDFGNEVVLDWFDAH